MGTAEVLLFFTVVGTTFSTPRCLSWESAVSVTLTSPTGDTILVGKYFCHTVMTEAEQWCLPI